MKLWSTGHRSLISPMFVEKASHAFKKLELKTRVKAGWNAYAAATSALPQDLVQGLSYPICRAPLSPFAGSLFDHLTNIPIILRRAILCQFVGPLWQFGTPLCLFGAQLCPLGATLYPIAGPLLANLAKILNFKFKKALNMRNSGQCLGWGYAKLVAKSPQPFKLISQRSDILET